MAADTSQTPKLTDPREGYPKPPFDTPQMEDPGLGSKMDPAPDHGEDSYKGHDRMTGRKALITGGDSGIGRAVAIAYLREGAQVAINYLPEEEKDAQSLKEWADREGGTLHLLPGDLTDQAVAEKVIDDASRAMGGIDTAVLNAGHQIWQEKIEDITPEQFDRTVKTNIYAIFWMSRRVLPMLPAGGTIITVTSIQGYKPSAGLLDYASTKFFIRGFTQALADQAIQRGVRVNGVAPGPFWTPLQPSHGQPQEKVEHFGEGHPYGRPGQPAEIAPAFVFLATEDSRYMNGEILGVTGGKSLG